MQRVEKFIRHIFFDLDDTLWDLRKNSREGMKTTLEIHGLYLTEEEFERFINTYINYNKIAWEAYYKDKISKEDLRLKRFAWTLEHFGIFNQELTKKLSETYMKITPTQKNLVEGCMNALDFFCSGDYKLHIITNGFPDVQNVKLQSSGILNYFQNVFISDNIGFRKPQIEIFKYCEKITGAEPEQCLMVGDQFETDVIGALNAGWTSVWLNRFESKRYTYSNTIQKLDDLILFF
jgi:putative hydrolase of the HAD superfamily